jgi:hypothetical protein
MVDQPFIGTFAPPSIGSSSVPIPLAGDGSLTATADGLVARAFRAGGSGLAFLVFLLTTGVVLAAIYGVTLLMHGSMSASKVGTAIGSGIVTAAALPRMAKKKPWEIVIPWASVAKVALDSSKTMVLVTVKKYKPKGTLHFKPQGSARDVVTALDARRAG